VAVIQVLSLSSNGLRETGAVAITQCLLHDDGNASKKQQQQPQPPQEANTKEEAMMSRQHQNQCCCYWGKLRELHLKDNDIKDTAVLAQLAAAFERCGGQGEGGGLPRVLSVANVDNVLLRASGAAEGKNARGYVQA
jgi:hypothetical protein